MEFWRGRVVGNRLRHRPGLHRLRHCRFRHGIGRRADSDSVYAVVENRPAAGAAGFRRGIWQFVALAA
ncbi:hypothetical protein D3C71_1785100 [compost metagenome]